MSFLNPAPARRRRTIIGGALILAAVLAPPAQLAGAAPAKPDFGPAVEAEAVYVGQSRCGPTPKPGVVAFSQKVMRAYPNTSTYGISRACHIGGRSEHKEGRAWDWKVNHAVRSQRRVANDFLDWLLKKDRFGNRRAMTRRFGIMYLIWNKRIWTPWYGWRSYCEMHNGVCYASDGGARSPHTDHVHFSFTWAGARQKTTWWHKGRSMASGIATSAATGGYWMVGQNGLVMARGAQYLGYKPTNYPAASTVAVDATPSGSGYWTIKSNGRLAEFGDARSLNGAVRYEKRIRSLTATPSGRGLLLLATDGSVYSRGDAPELGGDRKSGARWTDVVATPTGDGYWLVGAHGEVTSKGDAVVHGRVRGLGSSVISGAAHGLGGYWLATKSGRVFAFGDAPSLGGAARDANGSPVVEIAASAGGEGYRLVTKHGKVFSFGDAVATRTLDRLSAGGAGSRAPGMASTDPPPDLTTLRD